MARKNNPKQMIENIISVSAKLFIEKGYDQTSMQDIIKELGISKGAIFHHFKSKEEIFNTILDRFAEFQEMNIYNWIKEMDGLTAKEKLTALMEKTLLPDENHNLDTVLSSQIENPRFIVGNMKIIVNRGAPIIANIMKEGIEDGSIITNSPDECAEAFLLLFNIWCDPVLFKCDTIHLVKRFKFLKQMICAMCADIISEELIEKYVNFINKLYKEI